MFDVRPTALRFYTFTTAILLTASWAGLAAAQSDATSTNQWRSAGGTTSTASQATTASNTDEAPDAWQPDAQSAGGDPQLVDEDSNPLRQTRKPKTAPPAREPRAFVAPSNAVPMKSSQKAAANFSKPALQQRSNSAAAASQSAQFAKPTYMLPRTQPNGAPVNPQRPAGQFGGGRPVNHMRSASTNADVFETINVAYQGQPQANAPAKAPTRAEPDNLPMPGGDFESQQPVMRFPGGPGASYEHLSPNFHPYGEQGGPYCEQFGCANGCSNGYCDRGGCGNGCSNGYCDRGGCGDNVYEPGCGFPSCGSPCGSPCCGSECETGCDCEEDCEPGCGCPWGRNGDKEPFCIGPGDDESCHVVQVRWPKWQEVVIFSGVQGFKGPLDLDRDSGNFGINEGFNIGAKVPYALMGYQFGWRGVHSQLNGDKDTDIENEHFQQFVTAGLFHRQKEGLQFGVVWDMLNDERWHANHFHQLRTELSCIGRGCHEIGFTTIVGLNKKDVEDLNNNEFTFQASDQYLLFYRMHGAKGGEGRIFIGGNNDADGLVGSDWLIPIGGRFSVSSNFTYLIPNAKNGTEGATQEAWNIGLGLVWHWDGQARKCFENCYRPMFNVADNASLIVDMRDND